MRNILLLPGTRASRHVIHMLRISTICFLFSIVSTAVLSQAQLLMDINTSSETTYNEFSNLRDGVGKVYYVSEKQHLWVNYFKADGEEVAMKLRSFTHIDELVMVGSTLYFSADDGSHGEELWKSNGTTGGTVIVKDLWSGSNSGTPQKLTAVNSILYFTATNNINGRELWKSNGSSGGTMLVKDIFSKVTGSNPQYLTNVNGIVYFSASDGAHGYELWKSDGTAAGTVLVKDLKTAYKIGSGPQQIVNVNGVAYFTATEDATGRELYKSNGTPEGTFIVKDIRPGTSSSGIENMTAVNSVLFFTANDGVYGHELWKSSGSAGSTVLVKDMTPGYAGSHGESASSFRMANFKNISGLLFYTAYKNNDYYIWTSNGTASGTIAHYLVGGPDHIQPRTLFTQMDGMVFFFNAQYPLEESIYDFSLFKTNLTASLEEPVLVQELHNGPETSYYPELVVVKDPANLDYLYFNGTDGWESITLFKSGGYAEDTEILYYADPFFATQSSTPHNFTPYKGKIAFLAQYQFYGSHDIYITDGTEAGTRSLVGFEADALEIIATNNFIYGSGAYHLEIYRTSENYPGPFGYFDWIDYGAPPAEFLTAVNENIFFTNPRGELWRIEGTTNELTLMKTIGTLRELKALGSNLIFRVTTATNGEELWRSNGTPTGTLRYATMRTGTAVAPLTSPSATIRNTHYFVANDGIHGNEIWKTQGSGASTHLLVDLNTSDPTSSEGREYDISTFAAFRDSLYISAMDGEQVWSLYKYKSNASAVIKIMSMNAVKMMVPVGDQLYLFAYGPDQRTGLNLWKTNGTAQGTTLVKELPASGNIQYYLNNGILYFNLNNGSSLWRSDGTDCGTYSFDTGVPSFDLTGISSTLLFNGLRVDIGVEPYTYNTVSIPTVACNDVMVTSTLRENRSMGYPNPFTNDFVLDIPGANDELVSVVITTINGFPVEKFQTLRASIDHIGSSWPPGLYVMKVLSGKKVSSTIMVKK